MKTQSGKTFCQKNLKGNTVPKEEAWMTEDILELMK